MKSKDQFRRLWRKEFMQLGMDTIAALQGRCEIGGSKADVLLDLPGKIDLLLERAYDDLTFEKPNGILPTKERAK